MKEASLSRQVHIDALHYTTGRPVRVEVADGVIGAVRPMDTGADGAVASSFALPPSSFAGLPTIAPGLIDLQINGHAGLDFNAVPVRDGTLEEAARKLWAVGVTSFCPTVITNADAAIASAMAAISAACERDPVVARAVAGIHLEGPFISPEDGPRGAHDRRFVRPPDWTSLLRWQDAAGGRIRLLTLSPEWPGSPAFIERIVTSGIRVAIGHTAATPDQVADAVRAGGSLSTHLGNGCHLTLPRHPNYLWEQLAQDDLSATLIADGFHLPDQVLKVVLRVKGPRAMLVSDAVALCGMPPGTYAAPVGGQVVLTPEGKLHLSDNERLLAGSARPLIRGVEHLVARGLAGTGEAWEMASTRPAAFLGLPHAAGLAAGAPADLVLFSGDSVRGLRLEACWKAGQRIHG